MQFAVLSDALCRVMNKNGLVIGGQRNVECYELGGKVGKNTGPETHNGNNLAKLNDAKCTILCSSFNQKPFEKQGNACILQV